MSLRGAMLDKIRELDTLKLFHDGKDIIYNENLPFTILNLCDSYRICIDFYSDIEESYNKLVGANLHNRLEKEILLVENLILKNKLEQELPEKVMCVKIKI